MPNTLLTHQKTITDQELADLPAGSRVRGRFTLMELNESKPGEVTYKNAVTVEIEGSETPAIYAEWIGRAYFGA